MKSRSVSMRFLKNSVLFMAGSIFSKLISFLLLPLYTSYIPANEFGVYDVSSTYVTLISSIVYFEVWSALLRYLYDFEDHEKPKVIKASAVIWMFSSALFAVSTLILCWLRNFSYSGWIILWGISLAAASYMSFLSRGMGHNVDFAISGILNTACTLLLNVCFIVFAGMDYSALYISAAIGALAQAGYLMLRVGVLKSAIAAVLDKEITKNILRYALPLCLNTASYWLLQSATRLIYNGMRGDVASGIFSVGNRFGSVITLATTCFTYAWQDLSFRESKGEPNRALYTQALKKYGLFLAGAFAVSLPVIKFVFPFLINGEYQQAIAFVPMFLLVAVVSGYSGFVGNVFYAIKDTKYISISTIISGIVTVAVAYPLIHLLDANGANLAVLIGFVINICIRFVVLKKKIQMQIPVASIVYASIWSLTSLGCYYIMDAVADVMSFALNLIVFGLVFKEDLKRIIKK